MNEPDTINEIYKRMSGEAILVESSSRQARHQHLIVWGTVSILTFGAVVVLGATGFGNQKRRAKKAENDRTESLEQLCNVLNSLPEEEWAIVKRKLDAFLLGDLDQNIEVDDAVVGDDQKQQKLTNSIIKSSNHHPLSPQFGSSSSSRKPSTIVISANDEEESVPTLKNDTQNNKIITTTNLKVESASARSIDSKEPLVANEGRQDSPPTTTSNKLESKDKCTIMEESKLKNESVAAAPRELARFRTMLKVGIHPDAVRLKMTSEGIDPSLLFNQPQEDSNSSSTSSSSTSNANVAKENEEEEQLPKPAKDPALAKYETMLKVGIHPDAVKAKMKLEGIDPDCLFSNQLSASSSSSTTSNNNNSNNGGNVKQQSSMSQQQQQQQKQERVMTISTPLGELIPGERLPTECVWRRRNHATKDKVSVLEVDESTKQRISLLFKPPSAAKQARQSSMSVSMNHPQQQFGDENESILGVNGTRITNSGKKKRLGSGSGGTSSTTARASTLLPARRAQNLQIGFAKFKLDPETMCNAILKMEPEVFGRKDDDNLQLLLRLLPTEDEMKCFTKYDGDDESRLSDVERLFRLLATRVPDVSIRVESMIFVVRFPIQVKDLRSEMDMMGRAIRLLRDSQALCVVLRLCLDVGLAISSSRNNIVGEQQQQIDHHQQQQQQPQQHCGLSIHGLGDRLIRSKTPDGKLTIADIVAGLFRQSQDQQEEEALPLMEPSFSNFRSLTLVENEIAELERGIERRSRLESTMDCSTENSQDDENDETFVVKTAKKEVAVLRNQLQQTRGALKSALEYFGEPADRPLGVFFQDMCSIIGCIQSALVTNKFASVSFKEKSG